MTVSCIQVIQVSIEENLFACLCVNTCQGLVYNLEARLELVVLEESENPKQNRPEIYSEFCDRSSESFYLCSLLLSVVCSCTDSCLLGFQNEYILEFYSAANQATGIPELLRSHVGHLFKNHVVIWRRDVHGVAHGPLNDSNAHHDECCRMIRARMERDGDSREGEERSRDNEQEFHARSLRRIP